ncbi:MAG: type II toxin-antitoxin system VapC family toxin [Thermoleophilaceae bacterium]
MIVLDASVLIAHLDERDVHHERAETQLLDVAEHALAASPLTVAEVLAGPAAVGRLDRASAALRDLGLEEVPLGHDAGARLANLRAGTGLKLPDCCVLLAAQDAEARAIVTFDDRLAQAAHALGFQQQ